MPGRDLGEVFVVVSPRTLGFREKADAELRRAIAGLKITVPVGADAKDAIATIDALQAKMKAVAGKLSDLRIGADDKAAEAVIVRLQAKLATLARTVSSLVMTADTTKLDAAIAAEKAKLAGLRLDAGTLKMDADTTKAVARIAALEAQAFHLEKSLDHLTADIDIDRAITKIYAIEAELKVLRSHAEVIRLDADKTALAAAITAAEARIADLSRKAAEVRLGSGIDTGKLLAAEAGVLGIEAALEKMTPAATTADTALAAFTKSITGGGGGWGILLGRITLFGGILNRILPRALTSVTVWHAAADAVIELGAVLIPATLAFAAFGFAGIDAAKEIQNRMQAAHTVLDATGKSIPQLASGMEALHKAVQPQVYQLFGDALTIIHAKTGLFSQVAKGAGVVVDQLAARFTYAVTTGGGFSKFMGKAVQDLAGLGTLIGNIGGIFGNLFKNVPGYANILLSLAVSMTHVIEVFTQIAEPVTRWVLILHGAIVYSGLFVTATLAMIGGLANLARSFFNLAKGAVLSGVGALRTFAATLAGIGSALLVYATNIVIAGTATGAFEAAIAPLAAVNPLVWVAAAAVALGALVFWLHSSKDAAQQFNDSMQQTIANAQLTSVVTTIQQAQAATAAQLAGAQTKLAHTVQFTTNTYSQHGIAIKAVTGKYAATSAAVDQYRAGLQQVNDQAQLVNSRVADLAKTYGSNTAALGALNAAGITTSQITDKNAQHWAMALIQVASTTQAYQAMGLQAGALGNNLDVLGRTVTDQYTAIQKLNQGWSTFIGEVAGTQGTFDTVAQGFSTLSDHSGNLILRLGKLHVSYKDAQAAIDSLTPAGIALNQAFSDQVVNVDKLFASWRTAGLAGNLFTQGVKDAIAPLLKYANGSQEATAQLVALAQEAGYQGPISMQALTRWLGTTKNATQGLKDITNQATVQEALLTGAMQNQGSYIANTLIRDINNAILKYNGVEQAAAAYGNAVAKSGQQSDAARNARLVLIQDLIRSGTAAGDTTAQIAAMITKILGIPPKEALQIVMQGTGSYTINGALINSSGQPVPQPGLHPRAAAGGFIAMGSGPTADDVPILASRGEYIIRAASVAKYGKPAMDRINAGTFAQGGLIPGFAGGGLLETGNTSVLSGQYAADIFSQFGATMQAAMIASMQASLKTAEAAAQAAANPGPGGPGTLSALAIENYWMGAGGPGGVIANIAQAITVPESGRRPSAVQQGQPYSTTGWGLWQITPGNSEPQAGINGALLNPANNAIAAVAKYRGAGGSFTPWTTYVNGLYAPYLLPGTANITGRQAAGGLVPGYASGGVAGLRANLAREQAGERSKYFGLEHAFAIGPAKYRTLSTRDELATLAKHQATEQAAYAALAGTGLTTSALHHLGATARAQARTAADKALNRLPGGHPGFAADLRRYLGQLSATASGSVPAGGTGGGTGSTMPGKSALIAAQKGERAKYFGLTHSLALDLASAKKGSYTASHRKSIISEMGTLAKRQGTEQAAYAKLSASGFTRTTWEKLASAARAEIKTASDQALTHQHPLWARDLRTYLARLADVSAPGGGGAGGSTGRKPNPPWNPGNLGPSHTVGGGVLQFRRGGQVLDRGGWLDPGPNLTWNNTGRREHLTPDSGASEVHLHLHNAGVIGSKVELDQWLMASVNRLARTGNLTQAVKRARGR